MSLANPSIQSLKEMLVLEEKRAALQEQLNAINQRMSALSNSIFLGSPASGSSIASPMAKTRGRPPGSKNTSKNAARGTHREYIMGALAAAGASGVRVKDLAVAMKTKPVNVHSWFHANLKRIPSIQKLTGGHYRLKSGTTVPAPASGPVPKAGKVENRGGKGVKRGAVTATILEHLKAAGSSGIKIAELAEKMGANYKNIYIWFATTGKKHGIKRIAPATFRLA